MNKQFSADLLLLLYAVIMGVTSVVLKIATQELAVFNFIALRFLLAFLVSFIIFRKKCRGVFSKDARKHVLIVGGVTYLAHVTCTGGISMTPVSVAGFLTSLQTIAIPIIAFLFMHRRFERKTLLCITGAFISICLITIGNHMEYGTGMWICLASSALAGLQILLVERYLAMGDDPVSLTVGPLAVMALCGILTALPISGIRLPSTASGWLCIVWTGIISTAFATYIQAYAQRYTSAVHTGIIFASIPVFTLIGGKLVFHEYFSSRAWIGTALLLFCSVVMECNAGRQADARMQVEKRV